MVFLPTWFPSVWTLAGLTFLLYNMSSIANLYYLYHPEECDANPKSGAVCLRAALVDSNGHFPLFQLRVSLGPNKHSTPKLFWAENDFNLTTVDFKKELEFTIPTSTKNNGTLFVSIGLWENHADNESSSQQIIGQPPVPLSLYKVRDPTAFDLIGGSSDSKPGLSTNRENETITHIRTVIPITAVGQEFRFHRNEIPPDLYHLIRLNNRERYYPLITVDQLHFRMKQLSAVEKDTEKVNITMQYLSTTVGAMRMHQMYEKTSDTLKDLGFTEKDWDEVKGIFVDTNFALLALTLFVTTLHLIFDVLAFKNDISFWRGRKNMVGVSSRTLLWRCFSQTVISIYLFDQQTSLLVLIPCIIGTVIEFWKLIKAFKIQIIFSGGGPHIQFGDRSNAELATDKFDSKGMIYLAYVMTPLCMGGAVYSLLYVPHKSWFSWFIQSLANGVYAFGFLFMLPQLFVNYSLKSVAHLPWRAFTYKAFNTFIDDLFAFIITMPTAHRVACFRDDIVFLVYLYQRYLYPVDKKRVNEFGQAFDETDEVDETKKQK